MTALTGLVGLVAAVAAPVLRLNSAITRLSTLIDRALQDMGELKAAQAQLEQRATESQNALRRRIDQTRDRLTTTRAGSACWRHTGERRHEMKINWSVRVRNKTFWLAVIPAALLLIQAVGEALGFPWSWGAWGTSCWGWSTPLFALLALLGVVNDPTTQGAGDSQQALGTRFPRGRRADMAVHGVDLSENNGAVDFAALQAAGAKFVLLRCGYGNDLAEQDDKRFFRERAKARDCGLPWGAYLYSYA